MSSPTIASPNVVRVKDGRYEMLYRFDTTKSGRYRVYAIYTGLPKGCIGSGGKSFATEAERRDAVAASVAILSGWHGWSVTHFDRDYPR